MKSRRNTRRQLKRRYVLSFFQKLPPCLVGIEACATSHYWSRELRALGHTVRMMPPAYVKPYVKRQKNDAADAEAICEAVGRPTMRFVETKTPEQQGCLVLHRTRHLFIRQQTSVINAIRAHLAEFGIVAPVGRRGVDQLLVVVADARDNRLPEVARACVAALGAHLQMVPPSPTRRSSDQGATSQLGSASFQNNTRAEASTGSVGSASKATATCEVCSWLARLPSSVMPGSTAPSTGPGSLPC
jgi:hypothetical protein